MQPNSSQEDDDDEASDAPLQASDPSKGTATAAAMEEQSKTLISLFPRRVGDATQSRCGVCAHLNPTINGMIITRQSVRVLDKDGNATGRFRPGEVRIRAISPKECAPSRNTNCPARELRMVVGVNVEMLARRMVRAEKASNFAEISEIARQVANIDEDLQTRFTALCSSYRSGQESHEQQSASAPA